jgi:hypothetical protein
VCDRAQVLNQLLAGHADARIADRDCLGLFVDADPDRQLGIGAEDIRVGDLLELDAVERIRGIRDQLAQKDLAIRIE